MDKILTIAIPTYNRSLILKENLSLLFDDLNIEIMILVCDNHSTDKTYFVCKEYEKFSNFKYIKNKKNLGYDANVLTALENSNSKYVWFLADDDFVDKDKIKYVYKYLLDHNPDAVLLNAIVKNKNTTDSGGGEDFALCSKISPHTPYNDKTLVGYSYAPFSGTPMQSETCRTPSPSIPTSLLVPDAKPSRFVKHRKRFSRLRNLSRKP